MPLLGAVLDACVLYPMYLRDTLLRAAEAGLYHPYWSADILDEVRRNILADARVSQENADRLLLLMKTAFPEAEVTGYQHLIAAMLNNPKDRHVAAVAVNAGASVIVTENLRDFPPETLEPFGIEAQSADTFLSDLFALDSELMASVISIQASDYNAPLLTALELLDRLARTTPTFAKLVRARLNS